MPTYKITRVDDEVRDWNATKGGAMKSYRIDLEGEPKPPRDKIELAQKADTPAPVVGQELDGTIEERRYGDNNQNLDYKFKKAMGAGGGGGGRSWKPRPDDSPLVYAHRQTSILRQHSQDMALDVVKQSGGDESRAKELMALLGIPMTIKRDGADVDLDLVDAFAADVHRAANAAWDLEKEKHRIADAMKEVA